MKLTHFFLPHPETHKKAHLISIPALLIYIFLFLVLQFTFSFLATYKPEVLGINSSVNSQELIQLTNAERQKKGLPLLSENTKLNEAAFKKGQNMFEENYWAHYSPSGKDPWGFISNTGYKFSFAGENLARNFYNSPDVVNAWMSSPTHRDNILNSRYQEIGIAVLEGTLQGQPTILVVQEFGKPTEAIAQAPAPTPAITPEGVELALESVQEPPIFRPSLTAGVKREALVDPFIFNKSLGLTILFIISFLLLLDFYIIRRRAVERLASRHLPHLAFISTAFSVLINLRSGSIL